MPFRLDDLLHMDWAREHSFWDAFSREQGEIVRSVRPVFAMTIWLLTRTAGIEHYFPWHFVLVGSFLISLAYAGKTARYIAMQDSALYFTTGLFWLVFLPILNVLFWYGDLTYALELLFVAPAWYYGLRGLLEGKIVLWSIAIFCGICAVLAKEPALLLVHSIFVGTFIIRFKGIKVRWEKISTQNKIVASSLYIVFIIISLKLYYASPTRSNRFFNLGSISHDQLMFYINDRLRYYGETLLNPPARIFLITPLVYSIARPFVSKSISLLIIFSLFIFSAVISFFLIKSLIIFAAILLVVMFIHVLSTRKENKDLLIIPFALSAIIIHGVLLITVMLVKTQLTELSVVLLVIAGVYWSKLVKELSPLLRPYWAKKNIRTLTVSVILLAFISCSYLAFPQIKAKEKLLSDVRDVRTNANDAIKWMGVNLPYSSSVLVASPGLYGLGLADEMTSKDDEYKLYAQYTFLQGYVRSYFHALNRYDLFLGYLEDSVKLSRILDSCRSGGNYYLFLQTGLDADRFHGLINNIKQLTPHDTMLARFSQGPFPSEIWKLGK
jgi:hypothetical protein